MRGGLRLSAISSNDVEAYPQDAPAEMKKQAERLGFRFPYLYDETQEVARAYDAACTPDFFLFDAGMKLVYRGQLDDSRPRSGDFGNDLPVTGKDLRAAMDAVIAESDRIRISGRRLGAISSGRNRRSMRRAA